MNVCVIITGHFLKEAKLGLSRPDSSSFLSPRPCFVELLGQDVLLFPGHVAGRGPWACWAPPLREAGRERGLSQRPELLLSLCKLRFSALLSARGSGVCMSDFPLGKIFKGNGSNMGRAACA